MGAKESKPSCISEEEAIKRVTESEYRRIKDAFKKSTGPGISYLSQSAFQQEILCESVPPIVSDWLYSAFGGTSKGLLFKDLFCALVLLTRGKEDEKIRFLWNLYCNDTGTYILKTDYTKSLNLETNIHSTNSSIEYTNIRGLTNTSVVLSLFSLSDRVTFEQFKVWIINHKNATVLSKWLLTNESCINLTSELETPTFYQSLAGVTHLEEQDIADLEKEFWRLKNSSINGQLDLELLAPLISPPIPKAALQGLFSAFDENRDGHIDFKELCCGVSASCRGPNVERSKFCFKIFDFDRDGILNFEELNQMVEILIFVAKESSNSNHYQTITKSNVLNDLIRFTRKNINSDIQNELTEEHKIMLRQEDFMMWNVESSLNLVQPFLDLTFEVCHIVFGIRPQCKHMEFEIVNGWLRREERRGYKVGQFWYLISKNWWNIWSQYTHNYASIPCVYCKNSTNHQKNSVSVDEAMVCDESFNSTESVGDLLTTGDSSSLGSGSSGVSCGRYLNTQPGPIDNTNLITPNLFKSIRSLTGEGGHLKRDTPLVQGHDFELVPKSLWDALARWYGFILPLPRQVIQPPNVPDVELELYPLNLRILLHQNTPTNLNQSSMPSWSTVSSGYGALSSSSAFVSISSVPNLQPPKRYLAYTAAFSRLATVKLIGEFLCENLKLKSENIRLWHIMSSGINTADDIPLLLEEENMTLKELLIKDKDQLLLEIRNKDLTWPEELGSLTQTSNVNQDRRMTRASIHSMHVAGATGLHNLGNTCFMNAALQVLFNTSPLAQYFIKNMHLFELNLNNKLGTKGQLATRYGELLREIWTATTRSVAPLKLRFCVTKHAPQFAGGGQHDSQELLEWLLDALHEDLNRVTEKPYTELKDSNGRPDEIVAAEAWAQHHARNQSIVIDLFYGQLKSKVSCLCCGRESVRFDPFSLLSLPLPVENYIYFEILVIFLDGSIPTKYGLRLNFDSKYYDVKTKLANLCHLNPNLMLLCEISNSQIQLILHDDQKIKVLNATEIYAYQLPEGGDESRSRTSSILGVNIEKGLKDIQRSPALLIGTENIHTNQIMMNQPNNSQQLAENSVFTSSVLEDINNKGNQQQNESNRRTSKHSEISTSPESTFVGKNRKRISTANLLSDNSQSSCNYSSDEASMERNNQSSSKNSDEPDIIDVELKENITNSRFQQQQKDPCPCQSNNSDSCEDDDNNSINLSTNLRKDLYPTKMFVNCKIGKYLIAVHRKLTRQDTYFLSYHKTRPSLFGVPLLLPCYENGTNKDLYCAVWLQVSRLLSPLPPTADQSTQNHAADCDDSLGYDFPFTLRAVTHDGRTCALCPWSNFCRGCEIPCNDDYILQGALETSSANSSNTSTPKLATRFSSVSNSENSRSSTPTDTTNKLNISANNIFIAIDWDPTALHLRYQSTREKLWNDHETVAQCRKEQTEPVDLNHCLRAFTSEEKLEQWYHCGHCKGKKPATKKLQIWRLPPILIIHLKRFNCVNNKWVKSHVNVNFPFDDFDPTPYLASVPQETILRHNDLKSNNLNKNMCNEDCENEIVEFDNDNDITSKLHKNLKINNKKINDNCNDEFSYKSENNTKLDNDNILPKDDQFYYDHIDHHHNGRNKNLENINTIARDVLPNNTIERRKRLISTSLSRTPVVDGHFKDFHHHKLQSGADNFDLKYKLYAVVSHSGMLNGGHYVSYACNPNGSWYCYNDSSCREIPKRPNIDPSSSYLLFYERKYLKYEPYLPNCEGRTIPNGNNAIETDENENDLKKMCVIS